MPKLELPDRRVSLGGKEVTLRFSIRAIMALKELWGVKTEDDVTKRLQSSDLGIDQFVDVVWAATRSHHPEFTRDAVLAMLDDQGIGGLDAIVGDVLAAAMPADAKTGPRAPAGKTRQKR